MHKDKNKIQCAHSLFVSSQLIRQTVIIGGMSTDHSSV
jgi:hypothetical protein